MGAETVLTALGSDIFGKATGSLLAAHLHKPEKVPMFQGALAKFVFNGFFRFAATWSWWAFFGGAFYFFYRKIYLYGLIALGGDIIAAYIEPFTSIIVAICCGVSAKYLYCKKFIEDLEVAGYPNKPADEVNATLSLLGGFNTWAIIIFFLLMLLKIAILFFIGFLISFMNVG
jgi:hypothetical protein